MQKYRRRNGPTKLILIIVAQTLRIERDSRIYIEFAPIVKSKRLPVTRVHSCVCFFCVPGPISLSKAAYDTCRLETPRIATYSIDRSKIETRRPMKIPGPKNWYFSNKGAFVLLKVLFEARWWLLKSLFSSRCVGN